MIFYKVRTCAPCIRFSLLSSPMYSTYVNNMPFLTRGTATKSQKVSITGRQYGAEHRVVLYIHATACRDASLRSSQPSSKRDSIDKSLRPITPTVAAQPSHPAC